MAEGETKLGCVKTLTDLAKASGVAYRNVLEWQHKEDFPVEKDGTYNLFKVGEWRARRNSETGKPENPLEGVDLNEVKALRIVAEKEIAQEEAKAKALKNRQTEGELVSREAVKRAVKRIFTYVRQVLESYPARAATEFPEATRSDNVENFQRFIRLELQKLAGQADNFEESLD